LTPRLDASNLTTDHYTRNRIRLELLPHLARHYNPGVRSALLRLSEIAARDADYLLLQARAALSEATMTSEPARLTLDRVKMAALHPALHRHRRGTPPALRPDDAPAPLRRSGHAAPGDAHHPTCH